MTKVITFGVFDLFHIGHLRIMKRAKDRGDILYVGVFTNKAVYRDKKKYPIINQKSRLEIIKGIKYVDFAFLIGDIRLKKYYSKKYNIDIVVHGDDFKDDYLFKELEKDFKVIYLSKTRGISSTYIKEVLKDGIE